MQIAKVIETRALTAEKMSIKITKKEVSHALIISQRPYEAQSTKQ